MKRVLAAALMCLSFGLSSAAWAGDENFEHRDGSNGASAQSEVLQNDTIQLNLLMIGPEAAFNGVRLSALASQTVHPSQARRIS